MSEKEKKEEKEEEKNVKDIGEVKVDSDNLYREEVFTDLKVGSIRQLTPVKPDGTKDETRSPIFTGQAHMMTPAGPVPLQCNLQANNLQEAIDNFPGAIKNAIEQMVEELKELQRKEASRIVVPGDEGPGKVTLT